MSENMMFQRGTTEIWKIILRRQSFVYGNLVEQKMQLLGMPDKSGA